MFYQLTSLLYQSLLVRSGSTTQEIAHEKKPSKIVSTAQEIVPEKKSVGSYEKKATPLPCIGSMTFGTLWIWALVRSWVRFSSYSTTWTAQPLMEITVFYILSMIAIHPTMKKLAEQIMNEDNLFNCIKVLRASEPLGIMALSLGVHFDLFVLRLFAVMLLSNGTQIFRVQRITTTVKATSTVHLMLLASCSCAHHFGSFLLCTPDTVTVAFVCIWRVISISGHRYRYNIIK